MRKWLSAVVVVALLGGCSVFMAASGSKEPDLASIRIGRSNRSQVEKQLGKPISFIRKGYGDEATYQYFTGDKPSYGRAAVYAGLDVVTLGLAELATSPIESLQGDKHTVVILYTPSGIVKDFKHEVMKAPLPPPEKLVTGEGK